MDTVFDDGEWYCVATLADGTTSLYTSGAFGIIGAGSHASVRHASEGLLELAVTRLQLLAATDDRSLPGRGLVAIRALTFEGQRVLVAPEDDLGNDRLPASPLFHAAHELIGHVRMAADEQP